jgi:aspartokinase/homoserine dehydrogenase 1
MYFHAECKKQRWIRAKQKVSLALHAQATVGAGLPVLSTLQALVQSGDALQRIEGVLSGTLSFIFNSLAPGKPFSQVVAEAKAAGYTEPDPREDLSGA